MKNILVQKLHQYIIANNPDLLIELQGESQVTAYTLTKMASIEGMLKQLQATKKPAYIIEELCMEELTKDLRPSKYNYIKEILEEDFSGRYEQFRNAGILTTEIINLIQDCQSVFEDLKFSVENEDNRFIRYAITGMISEYLQQNSENENVSNGLQQSTEATG
jgi:hypothetical protein